MPLVWALFVVAGGRGAPPAPEAAAYQPPSTCQGEVPRVTRRLGRIEAADQSDRVGWNPRIARRDARRLARVKRLIVRARICTPSQHEDAAVVLLHSLLPEDHLTSHILATWAAAAGSEEARWVSAASYDRWMVSRGLPQWYGTQMRQVEGRTCLIHLDGAATDEERAAKGVPPLAELIARVATQAHQTLPELELAALDAAGLYCPAVAWGNTAN